MPQQGAEIDIVTGRPLIQTQADALAAQESQEEQRLKAQAQYAELLRSAPGEQLLSLIRSYLETRIAELAQADPQASAYIKILSDLGAREAIGLRAAQTLMNRYLKRKDV